MTGAVQIDVLGEALLLLPERAVFWLRRRMLIVADTHFGKSAVFGRHGLAVPAGTDQRDRDRLTRLVADHRAEQLVVLGDFLHDPAAVAGRDQQTLSDWSAALGPTRLHVVAGNHDRATLRYWQPPFDWHERDWIQAPFRFAHDADRAADRHGTQFTLSGHLHPVVRLSGLRKRRSRVAVFWHRTAGLVLPSFGSFTGGRVVRPRGEDRIFAVTSERVIRFM